MIQKLTSIKLDCQASVRLQHNLRAAFWLVGYEIQKLDLSLFSVSLSYTKPVAECMLTVKMNLASCEYGSMNNFYFISRLVYIIMDNILTIVFGDLHW